MVQVAKCDDFRFLSTKWPANWQVQNTWTAKAATLASSHRKFRLRDARRCASLRSRQVGLVGLVLQYEIISISFSLSAQYRWFIAVLRLGKIKLDSTGSTSLKLYLFQAEKFWRKNGWRMDHCSPHSRDWIQCFGFHVGLTMWFVWFETANFAAACSPCRKITWALKTTVKRINLELCKWLGKKCH